MCEITSHLLLWPEVSPAVTTPQTSWQNDKERKERERKEQMRISEWDHKVEEWGLFPSLKKSGVFSFQRPAFGWIFSALSEKLEGSFAPSVSLQVIEAPHSGSDNLPDSFIHRNSFCLSPPCTLYTADILYISSIEYMTPLTRWLPYYSHDLIKNGKINVLDPWWR